MFVITVEKPRREQAMHTHLRSYRGKLKNVCVCVCVCVHCNFVVVPAVSVKTRYNVYVYMYVYYTSVLVPGDPLCSYRGHLN